MYAYTWYQWLAFFYIYCFFGWIFESTYVSLKDGHFVNRGFLRCPMLPLYGTGAVMMLWVSLPVQDNLILVYLSGMVAATALEYVTGYVMERLFKVRYWDYSNQKFQLNSYICLSSSIAWGFLTILMTEVIHMPVASFVTQKKPMAVIICVSVLSVIFLADVYKSTKTALALGKALESMTKLRQEMDELQEKITAFKEEAVQMVAEFKDEQEQKLAEFKEETSLRLAVLREETAQKLMELKNEQAQRQEEKRQAEDRQVEDRQTEDRQIAGFRDNVLQEIAKRNMEQIDLSALRERFQSLSDRRSQLFKHNGYYLRSLIKGNPTAASSKFQEALRDMKEAVKNEKRRGTLVMKVFNKKTKKK